ncbi:MAG: deoxyribodipyrimidine photo-lyase, partial [Dehalococcoidia bacterium]|nr:deoxyribodipyrimidine photo-lyase [Dehalococcoidia bacterium]
MSLICPRDRPVLAQWRQRRFKVIHQDRIRVLRPGAPSRGVYVLYWMQASQRARFNHALEYAIAQANEQSLPACVVFCLTDGYPEANLRHYAFMLEGLNETVKALAARGVATLVVKGNPVESIERVARRAALVVTDRGYLRHQVAWRAEVAERLSCPMVQVETDAIVPVESASPRAEYAAATLRPKLGRILLRYLVPVEQIEPLSPMLTMDEESINLDAIDPGLSALDTDSSVARVSGFRGGWSQAESRLNTFLDTRLAEYHRLRSNPAEQYSSQLSPYLHFG